MKKKIRGIMSSMLAIGMTIALVGCGPQASSTQPANNGGGTSGSGDAAASEIKIGLVLAETGPASTLGLSEVQTARLLQKQLDQAGPINGKTVKLIVQDYETDDTKAVVAMDRLLSEGVVAVVGATQASTTQAIMPKAVAAKIPLLAVSPVKPETDNVFVTPQSSEMVAFQIVDWLKKKNITRVGWVNAKDAFGVDGLPTFEEIAKQSNIQVVAHEEFDATATDMTVQLTNVKKANPEVVIVWSRTPGAGIVARNFKSLGFNVPMIQSLAAANKGFLEQVKDNSEGIYVIGSKLSVVDQLPDSDQKKRLQAFRDAFKAEFNGEPDLFAALTHDGISMIVEAIKAGKATPEDITTFLNQELGKYPGITGTFDFAQTRLSPQPDGLAILGIEGGNWKYTE